MMWGGVAASCYRRMKPRLCLCERREKMVRKVGENGAKTCNKSCSKHPYEKRERSKIKVKYTDVNMLNRAM